MLLRALTCISLTFIVGGKARLLAERVVSSAFIATLNTGGLAGTTFPVFFSYDADQVSSQAETYVNLKALDFTFGGVSFTKTEIVQGGQIIFRNGSLQNVTASMQGNLPANSPVHNITFGFGGDGVIGYVDPQGRYGLGSFMFSTVAAMLNAASFAIAQHISPGSLATLFGSGLALEVARAESIPLPMAMQNVSVSISGITAPLLYVSPPQINLQVPWTVAPGRADGIIALNGRPLASFEVSIDPISPGIFTLQGGGGQAIAINQDGSLAGPEGSVPGVRVHPARPGDRLMILATGLGAVSPAVATGNIPSDGLRSTNFKPKVWLGDIPAEVTFSGLAPEFVGVNQLNVIVPLLSAGTVPIQIETAGLRTTNRATISIAAP